MPAPATVPTFFLGYDNAPTDDELGIELQNLVKAQTAPYKYPRIVRFVDELPKTNSGKINRAILRSQSRDAT